MDAVTRQFLRFRASGDLDALGEVFDALSPQLLSLALHLCGNAADAEDALQSAFVVAMRKADAFDPCQPIAPWLAGILAGEAKNLARTARRRRAGSRPEGFAPEPGAPRSASDPAILAERREFVEHLRTRLEVLPTEQRQALLLRLEHGLEPAEIAEVLALPPGTVRMRIHRGLQALRRLLPAGFATWIGGALPARGLAAVRQQVLEAAGPAALSGLGTAAATTAATTATATIATIMVKKGLVVSVLVLLASFATLATFLLPSREASSSGPTPALATGRALPTTASDPAARAGAGAVEPRVAWHDPDQPVLGPSRGSLLVRIRLAGGGEPVSGIRLSLSSQAPVDTLRVEGTTDAQGEARFAGLPAGTFRVDSAPIDLRRSGEEPLLAEVPAGSEGLFERELPSGTIVEGRTIDDAGRPVAQAELLLSSSFQFQTHPQVLRSGGRSGTDGTFRITLIDGERCIAARHPTHAPSCTQILAKEVPYATTRLVLPRAAGGLSGTVGNGSGPVRGARVVIVWPSGHSQRGEDGAELRSCPAWEGRTDAHGKFASGNLTTGEHYIRIEAAGHALASARFLVEPDTRPQRDFFLLPGATLHCTVRDAAGRPVEGAALRLWGPHGGWTDQSTSAAGRSTFADLTAGACTLSAVRPGLGQQEERLELHTGETRQVEMVLAAKPGIRGRLVSDRGRRLSGWSIVATDESWTKANSPGRPGQWRATTGIDGDFDLPDLGPHPFRMEATPPGEDVRISSVLLAAHAVKPPPAQKQTRQRRQTYVIATGSMPSAWIRGVVVGPGGAPLPGAAAVLWRRGEKGRDRQGSRTDDQGRFSIGPVAPGRYRVELRADGLLGDPGREFQVASYEQLDLGRRRLRAGARLVVRLLDPGGRPWAFLRPSVFFEAEDFEADDTGMPPNSRSLRLEADGAVLRSRPIAPGRGRVVIRDASLFAWPSPVELVEGTETTIDVTVRVGIACSLYFPFDRTRATVCFHAVLRDAAGREFELTKRFRRETAGIARCALLPGTWTVTARDDVGNRYAATLELPGDRRPGAPVPVPMVR